MKRLPLLGLVALSLAVTAGPAAGQVIVVPNSLTTVDGGTFNGSPLFVTGGQRQQQVYAASQFAAPINIGQITFRPEAICVPFTQTWTNVLVTLSTTTAAPDGLSTTFASNVGADSTVVYSGAITLSTANTVGPGSTRNFDININLQTPFAYNPAGGNLLLDIRNNSPESHAGPFIMDAHSVTGDSISRVVGAAGDPGAVTGTANTLGLVTRFTGAAAVPEPTTLALGAVGLGTILWQVRRRRRRIVCES
jgi:hypothetical protein